jgi:hypothetical protein
MELVGQIAHTSTMMHCLVSRSGGMTVSGCVDPQEVAANCAGSLSPSVLMTAIGRRCLTQYFLSMQCHSFSESLRACLQLVAIDLRLVCQ